MEVLCTCPGAVGYVWSSYDAVQHIRNGTDWAAHVVPYTNFATDAAAGNLPAVSWLVEPHNVSDHPPAGICEGENWTVQQINAVMKNAALWSTTAIILTWDDLGDFTIMWHHPNAQTVKLSMGSACLASSSLRIRSLASSITPCTDIPLCSNLLKQRLGSRRLELALAWMRPQII